MTLNKKLACLRKKEGLSQAEVSEKLDVSRQAVSRWEAGESRPSTENLQALSKLYNVPLEYLLDEGKEDRPAPAPTGSAAECGSEQEIQKKGKLRIRWIVICAVTLALLVCCFFWYKSSQKKDALALHAIQGESSTLLEEADFNLNWE